MIMFKYILLGSFFLHCCNGLNILGVFPLNSYSHYILGAYLLKELAHRGHNVTVVSTLKQKEPIKNYHEILVKPMEMTPGGINMFESAGGSPLFMLPMLNFMTKSSSDHIFQDENVKKFMASNSQFDLVICEHFFNEAMYGFGWYFNAPLIVFTMTGPSEMITDKSGTPTPYTWVPNILSDFSSHMNFFERLQNTFLHIIFSLFRQLIYYPTQNEIAQKYFPGIPPLSEFMYNVSLFFTNSHVAIGESTPITSNIVEIGGLQVSPKKLPEDLQKFLDEAKEGVVYFSMGSNLKSKDMNQQQKNAFINAFASLKQKVLWKFEDETLPNQPPNLMIRKWIPQQDVLAHPNVKVFITHGGLLSTTETSFLGVPIIGIPIFGDQLTNVAKAVLKGTAIYLPLEGINEQKIKAALNEILGNPRYRDAAKKLSKILNDQPQKPMDRAVYWVEYIHRHKGAPFLRPASLDLKWYQYFGLDIFLFIIAVLSVPVILLRRLCKKKTKSRKEKTQ